MAAHCGLHPLPEDGPPSTEEPFAWGAPGDGLGASGGWQPRAPRRIKRPIPAESATPINPDHDSPVKAQIETRHRSVSGRTSNPTIQAFPDNVGPGV